MTTPESPADAAAHRAHLEARATAERFLRRTLEPTILNRVVAPLGPDHDGTVLDEVLAAVTPGRRVEERMVLPGMRLVQYAGDARDAGPPAAWWFGDPGATPSAGSRTPIPRWFTVTVAAPAIWLGAGPSDAERVPADGRAVWTFAAWRGFDAAVPRWFVPRPGTLMVAA